MRSVEALLVDGLLRLAVAETALVVFGLLVGQVLLLLLQHLHFWPPVLRHLVDGVRSALAHPLRGPVALLVDCEGLEVEDLRLVLYERGGDGAALFAGLRVDCDHAGHGLIQKVAVLLFEAAEETLQAVGPYLIGVSAVDAVAVLEGAAGEDAESDAEDLCEAGVDVGGVSALLHEVVIDFLGGEVDDDVGVVLAFEEGVVVVELAGQRAGADDLDLPALVDEDVGGVHVADLAPQVLELLASAHDVVQQVPDLRLQEVLLQLAAVVDLRLQNELVVVEG